MGRKANSPSARKAKGRAACALVRELLLKHAPELEEGDIWVTPSGVTGEDLKLSPKARDSYPIVIECKCQETLNIWDALKQAESHVRSQDRDSLTPILFFKRNNSKLYVAMQADEFVTRFRPKLP